MNTYDSKLSSFWHKLLEKWGFPRKEWPALHDYGLWGVLAVFIFFLLFILGWMI